MKKIILILCLVIWVISEPLTTKDPEFEKKFKVEHIKEGDGKNFPKKNDKVFVHYTGTLLDGTEFDSSIKRGEPLDFILGVGQVIKCWDICVERLSKGEKIKVVCPSNLAYGQRGVGKLIKPNSDLVFEMELIDFKSKTGSSDL